MDQNGKVDLNGTLMYLSGIKLFENTVQLRKDIKGMTNEGINRSKQTGELHYPSLTVSLKAITTSSV